MERKYLYLGGIGVLILGLFLYMFSSAEIVGYSVAIVVPGEENYTDEIIEVKEESFIEVKKEPYSACEEKEINYLLYGWNGSYVCDEYTNCIQYSFECVKTLNGNCIDYKQECTAYNCTRRHTECFFDVINKDEVVANFTFGMYFVASGIRYDMEDITKILKPKEIGHFAWNYSMKTPDEQTYCEYIMKSIPIKKVCNYEMLEREVINKKNVTIKTIVNKTRIVNQTVILNKTKKVNRFFGYSMD